MADVTIAGVTLSGDKLTDENVALAWETIQDECGWHIAPEKEQTVTLDTFGGCAVRLPSLHVVDVSKVVLDGVDITGDVEWSTAGLLRFKSRYKAFPNGYRRLVVTMRHGYAEMPSGLKGVVRAKAASSDAQPKQLMAGAFLVINDAETTSGVVGLSESMLLRIDKYSLKALAS